MIIYLFHQGQKHFEIFLGMSTLCSTWRIVFAYVRAIDVETTMKCGFLPFCPAPPNPLLGMAETIQYCMYSTLYVYVHVHE